MNEVVLGFIVLVIFVIVLAGGLIWRSHWKLKNPDYVSSKSRIKKEDRRKKQVPNPFPVNDERRTQQRR